METRTGDPFLDTAHLLPWLGTITLFALGIDKFRGSYETLVGSVLRLAVGGFLVVSALGLFVSLHERRPRSRRTAHQRPLSTCR